MRRWGRRGGGGGGPGWRKEQKAPVTKRHKRMSGLQKEKKGNLQDVGSVFKKRAAWLVSELNGFSGQ